MRAHSRGPRSSFDPLKYVALTVVAGTVGMSIPWLFLKAKPSFNMVFLCNIVAVGWVFFPCIALLYRQQSPWMFPVLALATIAVAFSLRRIFPGSVETNQRELTEWHTTHLPSLYGLPIADFRPLRECFIAICAQSALIFAIAELPFLASILLSTCLFLLVGRWSASDSTAISRFAGRRQSTLLSALAILLTVLTLIPWVGGKQHAPFGRNNVTRGQSPATHQPTDQAKHDFEYAGIILWPPHTKKTEIIPPRPHVDSIAVGRAAKPVVVPFDGQYWYFKAPSKRPNSQAHVAHGEATDVNVHSSNAAPLLMEAYQNLGPSIDLACCSEIDIAITSADTRPGKITLGLRLTDERSIRQPSQDLGEQPVVSSEDVEISLNRLPVKETLRFPISRSATLRQFNAITVAFVPAKERARSGAKVSIQSFTLIPR